MTPEQRKDLEFIVRCNPDFLIMHVRDRTAFDAKMLERVFELAKERARAMLTPVDQPMQPLIKDQHGVVRFKANAIVRHLLDNGGIDMNKLAMLDFSHEDRMQFAQLIGYSVSGYGELSYVSDESYDRAAELVLAVLSASAK